ncbi:sensor histidine kinase [Ureibacillus acetophenoni]|uniref:Sensor histidine kinase n=1 Tax=Ureibacillus acetophenoni TaxID=614649 RepID=A0A285U937_9BACL|nr:sensor histidine kinase [Ureibacillus acetophenoni]SOC38217.1 two-component system vancomycin resistance sensor histidine kinase VraS [Ureibacillus acetophenoni]
MIAFIVRTFTMFMLLSTMVFMFFYFLLGEPVEETFEPLWEVRHENVPLVAYFVIAMFVISCFISIWMAIASKTRESVAIRYVKQLVDPEFSLEKKKNIPRSLKKALLQTNELIETQRKSLQKLTNERVDSNDAIIQERIVQERQRLARELHDSVSQQLFAASMLLSALTEQAQGDEKSQKTLQQVEKIVQQAQLEMRALLLHLRPIALRNNTLAEGLTGLVLELKQKVNFDIDYKIEEIELSKAEEDHLFRIAQEALSNTLRHSKATEVELTLIAPDNVAILRIQDNGRGFNVEEDNQTTSYGLKNIAERAVEIGCIYKIVSVPGEGTIVEVKVPLKMRQNTDELSEAADLNASEDS